MTTRLLIAMAGLAVALVAPLVIYPVLLMTILCFVIFASSFNLLLGYAGLLCFGHAVFFGGAAYITGHILKSTSVSLEIAILGGVFSAAALGAVMGWLAIRRQGIQFAMITLAFSQLIFFLLLQAPFTGGENGMQGIPRHPLFGLIDLRSNFHFYYFVLAVTAVTIFAFYRIVHSPFGEVLKAIRDNEPRVESLGFDPEKFKLIAFTLSAGMAGLAGGLKATVFQFATLTDVSWQVSGEVILMTLLGGLGTLTGPMFGAGIIVLMNDYLAGFGEWALIAQGFILLAVVVFFRRGFVGELSALASYLVRLVGGQREMSVDGRASADEIGAAREKADAA
jgi:branched-chain amino acid transport system permease protein